MRPYSPGGILNAFAAAPKDSIPPKPSIHRLQPRLPGYLILFAPLAFVPQRQVCARCPFAPRVFLLISTHSTATPGIPTSSLSLQPCSLQCNLPVEPWRFHTILAQPPTHPLRPVIPSNACPLRITAAAGTELARAYSTSTVICAPFHCTLYSSLSKEVYIPKDSIPHAASLRQGCPHCGRFQTAASRRSPGRISVPVWPIYLSVRLPIIALVGSYPTN